MARKPEGIETREERIVKWESSRNATFGAEVELRDKLD